MRDFSALRKEFPVTDEYVFMNNAAVAPPPLRVTRAVSAFFQEYSGRGILGYPGWMKQVERTRSLFAELINADPSEVCFMGNTSDGLSAVASGISWKPGDRVLVPVPDFPSNVYPWSNLGGLGVEIDYFRKDNGRFTPAQIEAAIRPGAKLITISSTDFATGFRCDLEQIGEICRRRGVLLCVDAIQSLGAVPLDVKKCGAHFLACGAHKWLLGAMGIGALYISREAGDLVRPVRVGWRSVEDEENFYNLELKFKPDARRFESGTLNAPGIVALGASLEMLLDIGIDAISERIFQLTDMLASGLSGRNFTVVTPPERERRAGILSFLPAVGNSRDLFKFMLKNRVVVAQRGEAVRLSPHFYNDETDVERFFEALDLYVKNSER